VASGPHAVPDDLRRKAERTYSAASDALMMLTTKWSPLFTNAPPLPSCAATVGLLRLSVAGVKRSASMG